MKIVELSRDMLALSAELMANSPLMQEYQVTLESATTALKKSLEDSRCQVLLAINDEKEVLGLIEVIIKGGLNRADYVQLILVREDAKGQGIGKALMQQAEEGGRGVLLLVSETNLEAQKFYQKIGYKKVGRMENFVKENKVELLFAKSSKI